MKRLKKGEYIKMSPEEQKNHRRELRNRWLNKSGNKQKVREKNREYLRQYWLKKKSTPTERYCSRCGKLVWLSGNRTICDECRNIPSKTAENRKLIAERARLRQERNEEIIRLATTTNLTQKEIGEIVGTYQTIVSKIIRKYCYKKYSRLYVNKRFKK